MDSKPWYASTTIVASVLGIFASAVGVLAHVTISDAQVQSASVAVVGIATAVTSLIAIYGRIKATLPIAGTKAAAPILPATKGQ